MLPDEIVSHFVLHKGMLDRVDPSFIDEAAQLIPIFANEVFAIYSRRGERLPGDRAGHLPKLGERCGSMGAGQPAAYSTAVVVTTYN
ncbi:MAG: hypothetical protein WDN48_17015 [Pseudolabrys sp.]